MRPKNTKLLVWLKSADDESVAKTGTTRSYLRAIGYGYKTAGAEIASAIELATDAVVTRKDLRDDWAAIWPELNSNEDT
jgi:DNA-binding transcriptional regulator YdaS (Cro superfamily)